MCKTWYTNNEVTSLSLLSDKYLKKLAMARIDNLLGKLHNDMQDITYGYITTSGEAYEDGADMYNKGYKLQSPIEVSSSRKGVCWDQTEYAADKLQKNKVNFKTFYIQQKNKSGTTHTFIVARNGSEFTYFENSYGKLRGIRNFPSEIAACDFVRNAMKEDEPDKGAELYEYTRPISGLNTLQFMAHAVSGRHVKSYD